jgi:hypothetical protein
MDAESLAHRWWLHDLDAWDEVEEILDAAESVPALIRSLATTAPPGALSYIGVAVLETIAMHADLDGRPDTAIDDLLAADLDGPTVFEILAGPYPDFLERWQVRRRFADRFTAAQLEALSNWGARVNQRLVLDGEGTRLLEQSEWFSD